jgi:hypothetical protein
MRSETQTTESEIWSELSPRLEQVVQKLRHDDRQAVLLRFYEQKSFAEVGQILGISEEAARKRVSRAIEELRMKMTVKDGTVSASLIASVLLTKTTKPAPAALASTISSVGAGSSLAKAVVAAMSWGQMKLAAVMAICFLGFSATLAVLLQLSMPARTIAPIRARTTRSAGDFTRVNEVLSAQREHLARFRSLDVQFSKEYHVIDRPTTLSIERFQMKGRMFRYEGGLEGSIEPNAAPEIVAYDLRKYCA